VVGEHDGKMPDDNEPPCRQTQGLIFHTKQGAQGGKTELAFPGDGRGRRRRVRGRGWRMSRTARLDR
jgi:hypothetical protein